VATIPQVVANIGRSNLGPIFLRRKPVGSSPAIYGLDFVETSGPILDDFLGDDIHEEDSDTDLILVISQMEILL
jgi:hypothetical protein